MKFSILLWIPLILLGQDNETCTMCHDDQDLAVRRRGLELSLYVTEADLEGTPHEGFNCIDCHTALEGVEDFPHDPLVELPDCGSCHEDAQTEFIEGFFRPLQEKGYTSIPTCSDCHGKHKVSWQGQPRQACGVCHQDVLDDFFHSAHWDQQTETSDVTCVSCHSPHNKQERADYTPGEWKIHLTESCRECHAENVRNYDLSGHYKQVLAGNLKAPVCSDCHARHRVLSPRNPASEVSVARLDMVCSNCHLGYEASIHRPKENSDPRLETCVVCHTGHETEMVGSAPSSVFDIKLDQVCLRCHQSTLIVEQEEAHGRIHRDELNKVASGEPSNCGNCHTYHYLAPNHPADRALEKSCADCHPKEQQQYQLSSHYISYQKGHLEAPTCITCHDEQRIQKANERFMGESIVVLCARCHSDRDMTMKFQLNPNVLEGYNTSYHGQMYQLGYQGEKFATCISCHDNHSILPSNHPQSTIHKSHIVATCSRCHTDVNENFVQYLQHYTPMMAEENPALNFIHKAMVVLLTSVLVIFGGHTILWLIRLLIKRIMHGPIAKPPKSNHRVRRFTPEQRALHVGMVLSFLTLAMTGLPLKYSHSILANWFVHNVIGFGTAAIAHRVGAGLMLLVFVFHLGIMFKTAFVKNKKGVFWGPDSLVPNWQDFKDFYNHVLYFIGLRKAEPKFGRWTYWEKFDYFAVFWGMFAIGASGLTLWFPQIFSRWFPGWMINAAHIIHSEEALLATGFIFTVHFFNTHLRPGTFPMDEAIFSGHLTEERFEEERPLQKEALTVVQYQAMLTNPLPGWKRLIFRIAAYSFLLIGLALLVLILAGTFS
ncbi:MAG: cytochrome c3 family protein [Candidatus Neomarinimicrobiota bacterium]